MVSLWRRKLDLVVLKGFSLFLLCWQRRENAKVAFSTIHHFTFHFFAFFSFLFLSEEIKFFGRHILNQREHLIEHLL
jgi:hypothetical protein